MQPGLSRLQARGVRHHVVSRVVVADTVSAMRVSRSGWQDARVSAHPPRSHAPVIRRTTVDWNPR